MRSRRNRFSRRSAGHDPRILARPVGSFPIRRFHQNRPAGHLRRGPRYSDATSLSQRGMDRNRPPRARSRLVPDRPQRLARTRARLQVHRSAAPLAQRLPAVCATSRAASRIRPVAEPGARLVPVRHRSLAVPSATCVDPALRRPAHGDACDDRGLRRPAGLRHSPRRAGRTLKASTGPHDASPRRRGNNQLPRQRVGRTHRAPRARPGRHAPAALGSRRPARAPLAPYRPLAAHARYLRLHRLA